jgi:phosphatidylglycerophosphate synthase
MFGSVVVLPVGRWREDRPTTALAWIGEVMTYSRIPLGALAALLIFTDRWRLGAAAVGLFVVMDVLDGRFARAGGLGDMAHRRAMDATIDKLSVHACFAGIAVTLPAVIPIWSVIVVRDVWQSTVAGLLLVQRRVVVAGAWWHRFFSLSMAVWAATVLISGEPSLGLAGLALIVGLVTLADYSVQCRALVRSSRLAEAKT